MTTNPIEQLLTEEKKRAERVKETLAEVRKGLAATRAELEDIREGDDYLIDITSERMRKEYVVKSFLDAVDLVLCDWDIYECPQVKITPISITGLPCDSGEADHYVLVIGGKLKDEE